MAILKYIDMQLKVPLDLVQQGEPPYRKLAQQHEAT